MGGFASLAALQAQLPYEQRAALYRPVNGAAASAVTSWQSFWTTPASAVSGFSQAGSAPGAAAVCTSATAGAIYTPRDAAKVSYVTALAFSLYNSVSLRVDPGSLILFDRLVHSSGLDATLTTTQNVNTPTLPARLNSAVGADVEAFIECYVQLGSTGTTATVAYTDSAGNPQTRAVTIPATLRVGMLLPIFPAAGAAPGFKSIESVTLAASTTSAGNFGVTLARRILTTFARRQTVPVAMLGGFDLGFPRVHGDACIWATAFPSDGAAANGVEALHLDLSLTEEA